MYLSTTAINRQCSFINETNKKLCIYYDILYEDTLNESMCFCRYNFLLLPQGAFPMAESNNNVQAILGMGTMAEKEESVAAEALRTFQ